jgi:hypothetical protein
MDEREAARQVFINPPLVEYSHQNPHPLYGKDPNILNAQGHTEYPKWIEVDGKQVIAKNKEEEEKLLPKEVEETSKMLAGKSKGWSK